MACDDPARAPDRLPWPAVLAIVLAVVAAVAAGAALERRSNPLAHRVRGWSLRAMLWALAPFAYYVNLAHAEFASDVLAGGALAVAAIAVTALVAWRLAKGWLGLARDRAAMGAAIHCSIQSNTTYLGLPLCAVLFSQQELAQAIVYDTFVSVATFAVGGFVIGALFGTGATEPGPLAALRTVLLRNPPLLAVIAGVLVPPAWAPDVLLQPAEIAVFAMLPLGFLAVGVTLADEAEEGALRIPPALDRTVVAVVALRMALTPALFLLCSAVLIDVPAPYPLLAAMPVGLNTLVVAHATGLDLRLCASAIAWSTSIALAGVLALTATGVL
jgi:predicted permease